MIENIKVLQIGCGKMSKYIMQYIYEKNGQIVGAVDINPDLIGKDISSIMNCEYKNITITDANNLEELINKTRPDIAIITTMSTLNDIESLARTCLKNKVNVITTCEEAFFASNSNPQLFRELDILAKAFGVTICGCGYQDVFWGNMITSVCGSTQKITKIKGVSSYNVEDYGIALAKAHGAGFTIDEFNTNIAQINQMSKEQIEKLMEQKQFFPSYMWNVVGWLSDKLGLNIVNIEQKCLPILADDTLESQTLNMTLEKGQIRGMNAVVTALTEEGIMFEVECIGKVYTKDEYDINEWTIFGEPTTKILNERPDTVKLTCADIVNRLVDVKNSAPGFISTSKFNEPKYIVKNF